MDSVTTTQTEPPIKVRRLVVFTSLAGPPEPRPA